jgi:hypothetical protein
MPINLQPLIWFTINTTITVALVLGTMWWEQRTALQSFAAQVRPQMQRQVLPRKPEYSV